jgi:hypothetical protein
MKIISFYLIAIAVLLIVFSCSSVQKIGALKPEPSQNLPIVYKTNSSFVSMPMDISLQEIENQLNKSLSGLIYDDSNLDDDKTEMKITKTANIVLIEKEGKIQSVLPLKIWSKFKYGTDFMGLNDTREIELNGTITLSSDVKLSNWKMNTVSKIIDFNWSESPNIIVAGKKVPITYIINPTLSIFKAKIAKKIDDAIEKSCDFKPYVLKVLEQISTPFETSKEYETWFKVMPVEVYVTDAVLLKGKVGMNLGMKCNMQTMVGQQPKNSFNKDAVVFKAVTKIPERTTATIAAISSFENASRIITKNFQGKEFGSAGRKITIQSVNLWQKDNKIIVELNMIGSINGAVYLSGTPNYNAITKEIFFDDMDYVLNSKGILTRTANWLLSGLILKKIQSTCRFSIQPNLNDAKKNMLPYLTNFSPMKGVFLNGNIDVFEFDKVELNQNAIIAFISGSGKVSITINGME